MPKIYSYRQEYQQPVSAFFVCEYCGQSFSIAGRMKTIVSCQKWVTERVEEALAEMRQEAEQNFSVFRRSILGELQKKELLSKSFDSTDIKYDSPFVCVYCGYHQRIHAPAKASFRSYLPGIGCGGVLLLLFLIALAAFIEGTPTELAYILLIGAPILFGMFLVLITQDPNRKFRKLHNLKKKDMPEPKKPRYEFGEIRVA